MENKKKKLLVFHQALAPYRVDLWNRLNELFDFKIYFIYENLLDQKFDQERLRGMLDFEPAYLNTGVLIGNRAIRWGFISIIKKNKPDIVFTYEYSQTTISLCLIKVLFKFNYKLYSVCDDSLHIVKTCSGVRKVLRNYLVHKLDGLILINNNVADWYRSNFGIEKQYIVIPILAKENVFRNNLKKALPITNNLVLSHKILGKKVVFFVGRLVAVKGIDRLIRAFNLITKIDENSILIIVGEGEEQNTLQKLAAELILENKVLFVGRYEGEQLMAWYNIGQVFVLASHYEPFGAVVNEALLAGAAVLCSTNAGASALVQKNKNGNIFNPYDIEMLSQMLTDELKNIQPVDIQNVIRPSKMNILFDDVIKKAYGQLVI